MTEEQLSDLNREIGKLGGLLAAHVKEVNRDRDEAREERREVRKQLGKMRASIATLPPVVLRVDAMETSLNAVKATVDKHDRIYTKIAVATFVVAGIVTGALHLVASALPIIKEFFFRGKS
jgi:hypothetical protein